MASKRRLRRRGCTSKIGHETKAIALRNCYLTNLNQIAGKRCRVYKCKLCGKYHVGRPPNRKHKRRYV